MQFLTASHQVIPKSKFSRPSLHNNILVCHFCSTLDRDIQCCSSWIRPLLHCQVQPLRFRWR